MALVVRNWHYMDISSKHIRSLMNLFSKKAHVVIGSSYNHIYSYTMATHDYFVEVTAQRKYSS